MHISSELSIVARRIFKIKNGGIRHFTLVVLGGLFFCRLELGLANKYCLNKDGIDLAFRFNGGECRNARGFRGLNPNCLAPCGQLTNLNLSKQNLSFYNLSGSDFSGNSLLINVNFYAAKLRSANFQGANLSGAWMQAADIRGSDFRDAVLIRVVFNATQGHHTNFRGADLRHVWWAESPFNFANFKGADLTQPWEIIGMNNCFPTKCWGQAAYDQFTSLPFSDAKAREYGFVKRDL